MLAKVCGLTNAADAAFAAEVGADLLGFVLHPPSPRHCADLASAIRGNEAKAVLVTVSQDPFDLMTIAQLLGVTRLQPHVARENRKWVAETLRSHGYWVLLPWADEPDQSAIEADLYLWEPSPQQTGVAGGSGQTHAMAFPPPGPYLLAGGLDGSNLPGRLAEIPGPISAWLKGADAASRLERSPGLKDPGKVSGFVRAVKRIGEGGAADPFHPAPR